jgi:predicted metal-dependent peptidase
MTKARVWLTLHAPFFGSLALRLQLVPSYGEQTLAADGRRIAYNPEFVLQQTVAHLRTIVAHETMHCALGHMFRRQNREPLRWNLAADHSVNLILKAAGFDMPEMAYCDQKFTGMAAEAIYPHIKEQPKLPSLVCVLGPAGSGGGGEQMGADFGGCGRCMDAPPSDPTDKSAAASPADLDMQAREWQIAVLQAAQTAKSQGKLPGCLDALVKAIRKPQLDWRERLRNFVQAYQADDYSWRRPNFRFIGAGDYLPSLWSEAIGTVAWIRDTSGSVAQAEHEAVAAELTGCMEAARPAAVHVVCIDTQVQRHDAYQPEDYPVKAFPIRGGGGTDLAAAWAFLRDKNIEPVCAILTSDLELRAANLGDDPGWPVLILTTGRDQPYDGPPPFGEVVKLEMTDA